jgi:HTH-type transcriptional regulator / antitoxin HigA
MHIRPIHTPADYQSTLKEVSALVNADLPRGTSDADRLDILGTLLQAYQL